MKTNYMKYITYMFSTIKLKFFIHIELFWITIRIFIQTHNFQFNLPFRTWICTAAVLNWLTEHEYSPLSVFFACSIYSLVTRSSFDLKNQLSCYTFQYVFPKKKKKKEKYANVRCRITIGSNIVKNWNR